MIVYKALYIINIRKYKQTNEFISNEVQGKNLNSS